MVLDQAEIDTGLNDPVWYTTGRQHAAFRQLRDEDPVHWTVDGAVTRHEAVETIVHNDCLGRNLARLELPRLFPSALTRLPDLELVHPGEQPEWTLEVSNAALAALPARRRLSVSSDT